MPWPDEYFKCEIRHTSLLESRGNHILNGYDSPLRGGYGTPKGQS